MKSLVISSFILLFPFAMKNELHSACPVSCTVPEKNNMSGGQFNNSIINGYALQSIKNKIRKADSSLVLIKVLHIGDSHVKSGYFSQTFMEKLNSYYAEKFRGHLFFNFQVFCKTGTKYSDYNGLAELDNQLVREKPDLVIISLGTNDSFSGSSRLNFYEKIDHLVTKIKTLSPQSAFLFTTPSDALKKNTITGSYMELPELQYVVDVIIKYANDNGLAYWDLHQVMGGPYSINTWYQRNLAATDRVHFTAKGYTMFADWLFHAFSSCMENNNPKPFIFHL